MSKETLAQYRALKLSNPFAAARFRELNSAALQAAEEEEHPEQHGAEIARRKEQAEALAAPSVTRSPSTTEQAPKGK